MVLRLPSEVVVERFLPTVRAMLTAELSDRGFAQTETAGRLGLTQAAVSKYLRGDASVEECRRGPSPGRRRSTAN